jgi:hypothetical protein
MKPTNRPQPYTTHWIADRMQRLQETVEGVDGHVFDEVTPQLDVNPKTQIAANLTKIEAKSLPEPVQSNWKTWKFTRKPSVPTKVDIEYKFQFEPVRLEIPPFDIPTDYGYDYMTDQLVDLTYQLTRLTVPSTG